MASNPLTPPLVTDRKAGAVPPYEPNPAFTQQPHMQQHDPYNANQIHQYPPQQQQYNQHTPMSSPPITTKQEYYHGQENNPTPIHPQQSMPPQQFGAPAQGYQNVIPLANLGEYAAPVDCPCCHMRALTKTENHSGNTTQ
ncbi:MAG: hypothetical protein Q9223_006969 [Gallowayella weberi]